MSPPIAIVGISVELPSGDYSTQNLDHKAFFEFLLSSGEAYEPIPTERFNVEAWKGAGVGKIHVDKGAFLKDIGLFDNVEFGISSKDAQSMAPATRKLLENSFLALLDSGIDYRMKNVGCFTAGTSIELTNVSEPDEFDARGSFAGYPSMIANRISNHLDLLGPSLPVDTACSSTLTAMHLAVQAISSGDCEAAVVGGCQLNHRFIDWITYSQGSLLAQDGKCKPFDSAADGFARAEGCAVVVIKPLEDALRDQDNIYATILGTAINSTGSAAPPGAPVAESQRDAMIQAFARSGMSPRQVDYVELHATGTAKGDPTEANWVGECFHREEELLVGSVKGNIGHTEITAFLASLSKVISIFDKQIVPPQVNIRRLNPAIKWEEYRLRVPLEATPLPCLSQEKSLVSIACSGIGGSNGHVVLESPPRIEASNKIKSKRPILITAGALSSRSTSAISQTIQKDFAVYFSDLPGLSTVLGRRAKQATWRAYTISGLNQSSLPDFSSPQHCARSPNCLVYVFSGQGPQHKQMGRELFEAFPVFRQSVLEMDDVFKKVTGKSIVHDHGLFGRSTASNMPEIWPIALVLPSIAIFQMALFDLLKSLGIKPDVIVGHSAGETAMLYASGAAPKEMVVELAVIRGQSFTPIEELGGTMAAVSCSPDELAEILREYRAIDPDSIVELSCFNAPSAVAIAGEECAIDHIVRLAEARKKFARKIRTKVPFHSSMMENAKDVYTSALDELFARYPGPHRPQTPVYSTLTGELFEDSFDASYFWNNTVSPVRFTEAINAICRSNPNSSFVELAPHPVLSSYVVSMVPEASTVLHSVQRPKRDSPPTEYVNILHLCGKLTVAGHNCVDFNALNNRSCSEFSLSLPPYPFSKKKYRLYPDTPGVLKQMEVPRGPLNHSYLRMNKDTHPVLAEHIIRGEPIMPAAGFLEMALEFGASTLMNVSLRSILSLSSEIPTKVNIHLDGAYWSVKSLSTSKARKDNRMSSNERLHADGYLSFEIPSIGLPLDIRAIRERCPDHIGSGFYPSLSYFSSYGSPFQRVTNVFFNRQEALASIKGMDSSLASDGKYLLHPAILDACIQVTAYKPFHGDYDPNVYYLPAHVDAVIVHQALKPGYFPPHVYAHVELKKWIPDAMHYDITLVDDSGVRLCSFIGLQVAKHRINPLADTSRPFECALQPVFHPPRSIGKSPCDHSDRSDLFGTLDKMTIRAKMRQKAGVQSSAGLKPPVFGKNQGWSAYFDTLEAGSTIPTCDGPQFDEAIKCSMKCLRNALIDLAESGTQVVQTLIVSNVKTDLFRMGIEKVIREFPAMYLDLAFDNKRSSQSLPALPSGMARNIHVTFAESELEGLQNQLFDIVLFFNVTAGHVGPQYIAKTAYNLLVPGGTFIVTERNLDAWDSGALGTMWYDAILGAPSRTETYPLSSYLDSLKEQHIDVLRIHNSEDSDPFHFSVESQKRAWSSQETPRPPLFDPSESFAYEYIYGEEMDLQWELSGLNDLQQLDVWITATEGRDGGAAQGLVRALRREYVFWTIRLVIFPASYDDDMRQEFLEHLPLELRYEQDVVVSTENPNRLLVPRLAPLRQLDISQLDKSKVAEHPKVLAPNHVLVQPLSVSIQGDVFAVLASIVDGNSTGMQEGSLVVGLTDMPADQQVALDAAALCLVPTELAHYASLLPALIPGFVTAILAPGLSTFTRPSRLRALRILVTHCDTATGSGIMSILLQNHVQIDRLSQNASLYDLAKLRHKPYDVIASGYTDRSYVQVMNTLIQHKQGSLFLWNDEKTGLSATLRRDPCSVGDALRCAFSTMGPHMESITASTNILATTICSALPTKVTPANLKGASFAGNKVYLILGGIGTIGAHLALFMYQRGARHIVLTSRSGEKSLENNTNIVVRRMFEFLAQQDDLRLSMKALDATDGPGMKALIGGIGTSKIGGCIILTAVLLDGIFRHLNEDQFSRVFAAKSGVLSTLQNSLHTETLEFIVSFTSVSGLIGFGGQTNYGAANTALELETSQISNGFSFICPGILDSTLMLAGTGKANETRLSPLIPWSVSAEDMVRWFDDAMFRFQNGQRVARYVPNLNWEALERTQGMPRLGKHLSPSQAADITSNVDDTEHMSDIIKSVLAVPAADFSFDVPLTAYGIDSLSASRISFLLRPLVEVTQIQLLADITLNDIHRLSQTKTSMPAGHLESSKSPSSRSKSDLMSDMLAKYSSGLTATTSSSPSSLSSCHRDIVLITGTTGTLGSNVLAKLLQDDGIKLVYAFNRVGKHTISLYERQRSCFNRQRLSVSLLDSAKIVLLEGDLTADDLGLEKEVMGKLLSSVTHIIHNAWTVDFVTSLEDHEDLISGSRKLLDFAQQSYLPLKPSLSYISTIGVFQSPREAAFVDFAPEAPILDPKVSIQTGYIESKWVAERLFQLAAEKCGLRTNVIRVGLLTGGVNGSWDPSQWFPGIVQSAVYLGCLPETDDVISWIPVDLAAAAIVDMRQTPNETLHLIHPKPTKWIDIMKPISKILGVPLVPYVEWLARLESSARDADDGDDRILSIHNNRRAALRLTHFYRIALGASSAHTESGGLLPKVASEKGVNASTCLQDENVSPLNEQDVEKWIAYWREIGFLPA